MKVLRLNILFLSVLFISNRALAQQVSLYEKEYGFDVNSDATIEIESSFTTVNLTTWDQNRVEISVYVKTEASSSSKADRLMEEVTIDVYGSSSRIDIESKFSKSGNMNGKSEIDIRLNIKAPSSLNLDFDCSFGDVDIPDWDGYCELDIQFGDLNLENLNNQEAEIEIQYSDLRMGNANNLEVNSSFSDVSIEKVETLDLNTQYDDVEIDHVNSIDANSQFSDLEIGRVGREIELVTQYGGVAIDQIDAGFEKVEIENQFGELKLYIDPSASYSLDVDMSFASFNFGEKSSLNHKKEGFNDEHFWGNIGNGGGVVEITSSFGGVRIK